MTRARSQIPDTSGATAEEILELAAANNVRFLRLQFTDILGINKNVEIPASQFEKALAGDIMFDGSSIEGFVRIEESDMYLRPDLATFRVFPWAGPTGEKVGRMICDIYTPEGTPFVGCPRTTLKKVIALAASRGYSMKAGPEAEFFLFQTRNGIPTTETHDAAGYFDLSPVDMGEEVRREKHVGLFDPDEALDRGPIEHHVAGERLLELRSGDLDVLVDTEDVRELQSEEADVVGRGEVQDVLSSCT